MLHLIRTLPLHHPGGRVSDVVEVRPGERRLEWGIVEKRLALADPSLYNDLYDRYGHAT